MPQILHAPKLCMYSPNLHAPYQYAPMLYLYASHGCLLTISFLAGEHRIWVQPTADGMKVVSHAKTFFEETGEISIVTELSDDPQDADARSPWETFPTLRDLLLRVSNYISSNFELQVQ